MKRIAFLVTTLNAGGINNFLLHLLEKIKDPNLKVSFLYNLHKGDASAKFADMGVDIYPCLNRQPIDVSFSYTAGKWLRNLSKALYPFNLFRQLLKIKPDILYSHDHQGDIITPLIVCRILNIRFLLQIHSIENEQLQKGWYVALVKLLLKKNDRIHFGSNALKNHYALLCSKVPDKVKLIYYFVNELGEKNAAISHEIRNGLGIPSEAIVVGFIGRLVAMKHVETIIEAMGKLSSDKYHLVVIGGGERRNSLDKMVAEKGLKENVHFIGKITNPEYWLNVIDINVLASAYEGQPIAVIECMNKGIVNICSNVTGSKEIIIDGENGILFEWKNPDELARKIEMVGEDTLLQERLREKGFQFYNKNFNPQVLKEQYKQLLEIG